jgi:hypothetical protein
MAHRNEDANVFNIVVSEGSSDHSLDHSNEAKDTKLETEKILPIKPVTDIDIQSRMDAMTNESIYRITGKQSVERLYPLLIRLLHRPYAVALTVQNDSKIISDMIHGFNYHDSHSCCFIYRSTKPEMEEMAKFLGHSVNTSLVNYIKLDEQ